MENQEDQNTYDIDDTSGLSEKIADLKKLFRRLYRIISVISVSIMTVGGLVFCLGVLLRPILRVVGPEHLWIVLITSDLLISGGVMQIFVAGLSCFITIWAWEIAMYSCISLCIALTVFELSALGMGLYIATQGKVFSSEQIFQAWYLWECKDVGSCQNAYDNYIRYYFIPQAALTVLAIILQWATVAQMFRYIKGIKKIRKLRIQAGELLHHTKRNTEETAM